MGDLNASDPILGQTLTLFKLSDYAKGLVPKEKEKYLEKLLKVDSDCPYLFFSHLKSLVMCLKHPIMYTKIKTELLKLCCNTNKDETRNTVYFTNNFTTEEL